MEKKPSPACAKITQTTADPMQLHCVAKVTFNFTDKIRPSTSPPARINKNVRLNTLNSCTGYTRLMSDTPSRLITTKISPL